MYKYRYITQTTSWPKWLGPFSSASKLISALLKQIGRVYISVAIGWYLITQLKVGQCDTEKQLFNPFLSSVLI